MASAAIQVNPAVRAECRKRLAAWTNPDYATALERCIWQWSQGQRVTAASETKVPLKEDKPTTAPPQPKAKAKRKEPPPPTGRSKDAPPSKRKKNAAAKSAAAAEAVALSDAHLLYANKMLQMFFHLRQAHLRLHETHPPDVLVWLDDTGLSGNTEPGASTSAGSAHVKRIERVFDESKRHTSVQPKLQTHVAFLVCKKCKSTDVGFNQKQTRSGDEGMTSFCRCNACSHTWTM